MFYDYDEIEYLTECRFRAIPALPAGQDETSDEVWYPVGPHDIFPEEFATFLLTDVRTRDAFVIKREHLRRRVDRCQLRGVLDELDGPLACATRKLKYSPPRSKRLQRRDELGARPSVERAGLVVFTRPGAVVGRLLGQKRFKLTVRHDKYHGTRA